MTPRQPHFCKDCGNEFTATGPRQLRCPDCDHEPLPGGMWKCITSGSIWFGWRHRLASWQHLSIPDGAILWNVEDGTYVKVRKIGKEITTDGVTTTVYTILFERCDAPETIKPVPGDTALLDNQLCHRSPGRQMKVRVF